jgi:UTP--glucose-1-phosphate uridylyltransferase
MRVRTAVIPVAGLGTRFLPATKSVPKEMLPILDRPCVDYIVREAADAGIERIIFVTARRKDAMIDYFDSAPALEAHLHKHGKIELLEKVIEAGRRVDVITIRQRKALGLGHAILTAKPIVGDEPFAILLGDDVVFTEKPVIGEMIKVYHRNKMPSLQLWAFQKIKLSGMGSVLDLGKMIEKCGSLKWLRNLTLKSHPVISELSGDMLCLQKFLTY